MTQAYSEEGNKTLAILKRSSGFTNWMYSKIKPFLQGNILELGSGIGTFSEKIINDFRNNKITLSDIDPVYIEALTKTVQSKRKCERS